MIVKVVKLDLVYVKARRNVWQTSVMENVDMD